MAQAPPRVEEPVVMTAANPLGGGVMTASNPLVSSLMYDCENPGTGAAATASRIAPHSITAKGNRTDKAKGGKGGTKGGQKGGEKSSG